MCLRAPGNGELDRPSAGAPPRLARVAEEAAFATPPTGADSGAGPAADDTLGLDSAKLITLPALPDKGGGPFLATVASAPEGFFAADQHEEKQALKKLPWPSPPMASLQQSLAP